jgi:hypothetical protein
VSASAQEEDDFSAEISAELSAIKRLCVEGFVGFNPHAAQAREMAIASIFAAKKFRLTENCEKADAVLKGSVTRHEDLRVRAEGESINFGAAAGYSSSSGSLTGTRDFITGSSSGHSVAGAVEGGNAETLASAETISQASITLRVVNSDGDILWAHTEEAKAGKVKGPVAFAMDRAVKRLIRDIEKARKAVTASGS